MSQVKDSLLDHRYRITRLLRNSPGERWYAGMHVELDVPVRIIVLHPSIAARAPVAPTRSPFWSFAGAAATLRHVSLPRVCDCFACGGDFGIVTDPVPGEWLDARVERTGPLDLREALAIGLRLCDALSYVRRAAPALVPMGTITPEQLAIGPDGRVLLADLGVRRWLDGPEPEQLSLARARDERDDLAGIAAVLLFALTGTMAEARGRGQWQSAVRAYNLPPVLVELLEEGLALEPRQTLRTPEAFGAALADIIRHVLPTVATETRRTETRVRVQAPPPHTPHEVSRAQQAVSALAHDAARTVSRLAEGSLRHTGERARTAVSSALHWIA
ncbi:MAG TPA: hypothetical protein VE258_06335 [Ktedonobacterales bacterium]|nr:hypothetical protein [Ktedonobacterales bacterium]